MLPGPKGRPELPKFVVKPLLRTAATSITPAGRTRYASAPTPTYSATFAPSVTRMCALGVTRIAESLVAVPPRLTSAMWNTTSSSDPGPRLVSVIVSVMEPDGPPPSSIRTVSTAAKPRPSTFVHVMVAVSPA
jgi:hypothetical protein